MASNEAEACSWELGQGPRLVSALGVDWFVELR